MASSPAFHPFLLTFEKKISQLLLAIPRPWHCSWDPPASLDTCPHQVGPYLPPHSFSILEHWTFTRHTGLEPSSLSNWEAHPASAQVSLPSGAPTRLWGGTQGVE
jgi:hypothetical protein